MKGIVIYKGRYGATKQYAAWIGNDLGFPIASVDRFPPDELSQFDYLIIGSSVYMGKLEIKNWLKKHVDLLLTRKNFFFQVAASPTGEKEKRETYNRTNIPATILSKAEVFFFPGRMIKRNLSWPDRFLLRMGAKLTKDPLERNRMLSDFDDVKKENIISLTDAVKNFAKIDQSEKELV